MASGCSALFALLMRLQVVALGLLSTQLELVLSNSRGTQSVCGTMILISSSGEYVEVNNMHSFTATIDCALLYQRQISRLTMFSNVGF
jgi:hypothetical protein